MACHAKDLHLQDCKVHISYECYSLLIGRLILGGILVAACASFAWAQPRVDTFVVSTTHQTIDNFGASDCWLAQAVGGWSNTAQKTAIADLLFSTTSGIGLSCWRFNLGAGIDSTITDPLRTAETFEPSQGQFVWTNQAEEQWFLSAAKARGVPQFLAFVNSPPSWMTRNGHTYCPSDSGTTNLKSGYEQLYAQYLVTVLKHFRDNADPALRINFNYISPVNEPQWSWTGTGQEGNRASNTDIKSWIQALNSELIAQGLNTQIAALESGNIPDMYGGSRDFVDSFAGDPSVNAKMGNIISYHSYGSDDISTQLIQNRQSLANKMAQYPGWKAWMTEYCILGSGGPGRDLTMNTALNVARVIHYDLSVANASAWQWWLAMSSYDYKDGLIYVDVNKQTFVASKTLWALGNYSRFIRPGAQRIDFTGDNSNVNGLLVSAYRDTTAQKIIAVYVNQNASGVDVRPNFINTAGYQSDYMTPYVTSDTPGDNLKQYAPFLVGSSYTVPARAVVTLLSGTFNENNDGKVFSSLTGNASYTLGSGVLTINPGQGAYSGVLSGAGGIRKSGSGTFTLTAQNTYSGDTIVSGGTLEIAGGIGANGTSLIDIQSGKAALKTVNLSKTNLNINTAALATFEVVNGTHALGAINGSGTTQVDSGANLTAASIAQGTLTIASGATVTIQALPGGPQSGGIVPVPEPSVLILLTISAISFAACARHRSKFGLS
jgi:autotransporter-associated beta strand protein